MYLAGPFQILFSILSTVWHVLSTGVMRGIPALGEWIGGGRWFEIALKVGLVLVVLFVARSMWARLADIGDSSPMTTVVVAAMLMGGSLLALVVFSTGFSFSTIP